MSPALKSEKVILSAPFSFSGSAQRIWKLTQSNNQYVKWLLLVPMALLLVSGAWVFVFFWYILMYVVFGVFFLIWRLFRRSSRKNKADKLRHKELLAALEKQKKG